MPQLGNEVITGGYGTLCTLRFAYQQPQQQWFHFLYTATQPGTYVFTVTDSRGCPATSNTITVTPKQRQHILR
jgi:hypothetical protein